MVLLSQVRNAAKRLPMIKFRGAHKSHKPEIAESVAAAPETVAKSTAVCILCPLSHDSVMTFNKRYVRKLNGTILYNTPHRTFSSLKSE